MILTLRHPDWKTPFGNTLAYGGFIILAEPIADEYTLNDFYGQEIIIRPASHYTDIFKKLEIEVVSF